MAPGRLFIGLFLILQFAAPTFAQVKKDLLPDGVEHWYLINSTKEESSLTRRAKELYNIAIPKTSAPPFGRSIAFLVGVSAYKNLTPQLPSVHKDIEDMRDFALSRAGFDEVYIAKDDIVSRDLVERYVKEIIIARMSRSDRLLFYYSGHGGDNLGKTGYMLFSGAQKGQFWGPQVLAVDVLADWSRELPINHILFILDSCASGLGIDSKASANDSDKLLIQTLSGNGSRTVLTAGTADEATYAQEGRQTEGNGVFTRAFLDSFEHRSSENESSGFITVTNLFADVEKEMAKFRIRQGKTTTPRIWFLQESDFRGTFVFLNLRATSAQLTDKEAQAMQAIRLRQKGVVSLEGVGPGVIQVYSEESGKLYIDDRDMGFMIAGQTRQFLQEAMGEHQLRHVSSNGASETHQSLFVESGKITYANFGLKSPIDKSGSIPVGTLIIGSNYRLTGEVYIDDFNVGRLDKSGQLTVADVVVGQHRYRINGAKQSEMGTTLVKPGEIDYTVLRPNPPTGLTVTVQ